MVSCRFIAGRQVFFVKEFWKLVIFGIKARVVIEFFFQRQGFDAQLFQERIRQLRANGIVDRTDNQIMIDVGDRPPKGLA